MIGLIEEFGHGPVDLGDLILCGRMQLAEVSRNRAVRFDLVERTRSSNCLNALAIQSTETLSTALDFRGRGRVAPMFQDSSRSAPRTGRPPI